MKTAVIITGDDVSPRLAPFFAHCNAVLISNGTGLVETIGNPARSGDDVCDIVLGQHVTRLICGFIPEASKALLQNAGVDVRLGSCARSVTDLIGDFMNLPLA